jgi:hypothetical protein
MKKTKKQDPVPVVPKKALVSINAYAKAKGIPTKDMRKKLKMVGLWGRINPLEADRLLELAEKPRYQSSAGGAGMTAENSYAEADRREKWAKAQQQELKLQTIQGTLVLRAAADKETFEIIRRARDKFLNIPARLAGILAAESDQARVFEVLTRELHQALEDLSTWKPKQVQEEL